MSKSSSVHAPLNKPSDYSPYEGGGQWWTANMRGEHRLQAAKTGLASYGKGGVPLLTLPQVLAIAVRKNGRRPALRSEMMPALPKGQAPPPALPLAQWKTWSWQDYSDDARAFAKACIAMGLQQHQTVNIFGFNSPEWVLAMMGGILAGGKAAGIYPSDNEEQVKFKCNHSDGVVAAVENEANLLKFKSVADELPLLKAIVIWSPGSMTISDITTSDGRVIKVILWEAFLRMGRELSNGDEILSAREQLIKPNHCCCLVYTSGTTGNPKAVMIAHDSLIFGAHAASMQNGTNGVTNTEERIISYLPLSHIAGIMVDVISALVITSNIIMKGWVSTNFARSYDIKLGTLVDRLKAIKPTQFLGVPRVWEKVMEKLRAVGASSKGLQKTLATFAKSKGAIYTSSRQLGEHAKSPMGLTLALLILKKVKAKLGLDQCKFMFAGAAPMTRECLEYFGALGININEVYGMSETCGIGTWSSDRHHVWGSVGYEMTGCEVRVLNISSRQVVKDSDDLFAPTEEEQGEIAFRGRVIMMGYMANERLGDAHVAEIEQKNADAIDENGWMHSGDKGTRDARGMFKITGRYKELIITAGGENIAPVPIEDELKRMCPFISNAMMVGNKRKFNVMLVSLKAKGATGELPGSNTLAPPADSISTAKTITEAMSDDGIITKIEAAIIAINKNKSIVPSNAAKVQKFTILPRDFSVVTGELTPTLKLKRQVVDDEFEPIISRMYSERTNYVNYMLAPTPGLQMGAEPEADEPREKNLSFNIVKEVSDQEVAELADDMPDDGDNEEKN